jgi:hypothetical protein
MSYGHYPPVPTVTTISINPQPGTQATTAASYSGNLNITPTSISNYGSVPSYSGTVTQLHPKPGCSRVDRYHPRAAPGTSGPPDRG